MLSRGLRLLIFSLLVVTFSVDSILGIAALTIGFGYAVGQRVQRSSMPAGL